MKAITITRWIGRISSLALALLLTCVTILPFLIIKTFVAIDIFELACMLCLVAGLVLSWPREKTGIILVYSAIAAFIAEVIVRDHSSINWPVFLLLGIPTTLLLLCRMIEGNK
jgi:hypothetical protein